MSGSFKSYLQPGVKSEKLVAMLLISAVALLPFARLIELPMAILAGLGIYLLISKQISWSQTSLKYYGLAFLLFVVPMLLALPDAVNVSKGAVTTLGTLRYFFAGLAIIVLGGNKPERLGLGVTLILCIWGVDAFWQLGTGANFLGYEYTPGRANSFFGDGERLKLGFAVVVFFPLVLIWAEDKLPWPLAILLAIFLFSVILITGKRTAWLMASIEIVLLLGYFWRAQRIRTRTLATAFLALVVAVTAVLQTNEEIKKRTDTVIAAMQNWNYETVDTALSLRLVIWENALEMAQDHWFNGVGPRGFRYAYADYAEAGDRFNVQMENGRGAKVHHAHQLLLEVSTETGLIGLAGLLSLWVLLIARWMAMNEIKRYSAAAFGVALFAWFFPFNSHLAIYSSWSAQLVWMLMALYFSAQSEDALNDHQS